MAKTKKKAKKKLKISKYNKFMYLLLGIILLVLIIMIGYKVCTKYIFNKNEDDVILPTENKVIELDNYDYYLHGNATKYENDLAKELKKNLSNEEINEEKYARSLTKLFISDLFTLSNKNGSSDITSSQYVYDDYKDTFITKVKDTIYSSIEVDLDGTRTQALPTVTNVEITNLTNKSFSYNGKVLDSNAYYINVNISYEKDLGYPSSYEIVLVKNKDLLQVVRLG